MVHMEQANENLKLDLLVDLKLDLLVEEKLGIMPLSANDAVALAVQFQDLATDLSNFRFNYWNELQENERFQLESIQWTLMNYSSDFATTVMNQTLVAIPNALHGITEATQKAVRVLQTTTTLAEVINVASAAAVLGAAIATDNPSAVAESTYRLISLLE
jgi:hypothetical protein